MALYAAFTLTGFGQTLPGSILPMLSAHWAMQDARAGLLFAAQFSGGAIGGLLTRRRFPATLMAGLACAAISAWGISVAGATAAFPLLFLYGLGNGAAMTATSMIIGSRYTERRGAALSLLNFFWSGGAALCPLMMARLLETWTLRRAFTGVACVFVLIVLLLAVTAERVPMDGRSGEAAPAKAAMRMVLFFALLAFLYVGIENTMGGWLSTYAHRIGIEDARHATAMATFFWGALLAGRGLISAVLLVLPERRVYLGSLVLLGCGIALVVAAHAPLPLAVGAVVTGLALAPIFPLNLSLFMARAGEFSRAGMMLAISGFGGSVLPWLTGVVSGHSGSLRLGLLVPALAVVLMLALALAASVGPEAYLRPAGTGESAR